MAEDISQINAYHALCLFSGATVIRYLDDGLRRKELVFLGLNIPAFFHSNGEIKAVVKTIHETLANVGYFLIAAHAGAALFHHAIQKDNTLLRMMPEHKHLK